MTTSALIDIILKYGDNTDSADADNSNRRARILQYAQEVFDYVWGFRDWRFKYRTTTVTLTTGSTTTPSKAQLPADFSAIGRHGLVLDSDGNPWEEEFPQNIHYLQRSTGAGEVPYLYSILDFDTTNDRYYLQAPNVGSDTTLRIYYEAVAPTLVDSTTSSNNLPKIPAQYHNIVLVPGVLVKTRKSIGDPRDYTQDFREGLNEMVRMENHFKTNRKQLPRAIPSSW